MIESLSAIYKGWGQYSDQEKKLAVADSEKWSETHPDDSEVRLLTKLFLVRDRIKHSDLEVALEILEDTEGAFSSIPSPWTPELFRLRAVIYQIQGRRSEAFQLLIRAYTSAEASSSPATLAQISLNLGIIAANTGDYDGASVYLQRSLELSEQENLDPAQVAQAHLILSQAQLERGAHEDAEHHAARSFEIFSSINNAQAVTAATLLASIHLDRNDLRSARAVLSNIQEKELTPFQQISLWNLAAKLGSLESRVDEANRDHDLAIELSTKIGNNRLRVNSVQLKCETLLSASQYSDALNLLTSIEQEASDGYNALSLHELRGKALEGLGKYREALEEQKKFSSLQKELLSQRATNALSRLRAAHEVLQAEREAAHFRERSQFYAKELSQRTSYLVQQNQYVNEVIDHIKTLMAKRPEVGDLLKDIGKRLRQLPAATFDWTEYLRLFDEIHPNALAILRQKYPALSEAESQICTLVLAKLSNPEIARLLAVSERTVENHRYRLRKKLEISVDVDLAHFLEQTLGEKPSKALRQ